MQQQLRGDVRLLLGSFQPGIDGLERGVLGHLRLALHLDPRLAEAVEVFRRFAAQAPGFQRLQPAFEHGVVVLVAVAVAVELRAQVDQQLAQALGVGGPGGAGLLLQFVQARVEGAGFLQQLAQRAGGRQRLVGIAEAGLLLRQQGLQQARQGLGAALVDVADHLRRRRRQRVEVAPPVVAHHFGEQFALVGDQVLGE